MARTVEQYLRQLLSIHWLRPETALWRTFDCLLLRDVDITGRTVDLGCGDGTFSYIMAGGKINNYDVFMNIENLSEYNRGADIHDVVTNETLENDNSNLRYKYTYGIDHKEGLISKAKRFRGFYENAMVHDLNQQLPFTSDTFDTAFSNILYWLNDLEKVLNDWNRVLKNSGKLILFVPNENFKQKAWLYYSAPHEGDLKYFNFFDRGYNSLIHHCYNSVQWENIFRNNGFKIHKHVAYLTNPVMNIWNVGTRPIAAPLINMASKLTLEARQQVKEEWVNYFSEFFIPIINGELKRDCSEDDCAFHFYVLEKDV